jgi:hypothetical protein
MLQMDVAGEQVVEKIPRLRKRRASVELLDPVNNEIAQSKT